MRKQFTESLEKLHVDFHALGGHVTEQIQKSVLAFNTHDKSLAQEVIDDDEIINNLESKLEQQSIELVALQSPVTSDLRKIITIMKASSDLERMADHAKGIARATIRIKNVKHSFVIEDDINTMSQSVLEMVRRVLDAYVQQDVDKAREVSKMDDKVDDMRYSIRDLAIQQMVDDSETIPSATDYVQVASDLERIADYATNIAEWILYLEKGKIVDLD